MGERKIPREKKCCGRLTCSEAGEPIGLREREEHDTKQILTSSSGPVR